MATSSGICVICTRLRGHDADAAADEQRHDQESVVLRDDAEDGRAERDRHARDAVPVAAPRGLLVREAAEREDEEYRRRDVGDRDDAWTQHDGLTCGTFRACAA